MVVGDVEKPPDPLFMNIDKLVPKRNAQIRSTFLSPSTSAVMSASGSFVTEIVLDAENEPYPSLISIDKSIDPLSAEIRSTSPSSSISTATTALGDALFMIVFVS